MNYGDRQERAGHLVKVLRMAGDKLMPTLPSHDRSFTANQVADEIEQMTDLGRNLVAVAGFVYQAMLGTPDFFGKDVQK